MWQLAEAKNKFSELVEKAIRDGPQFVSKHGREAVVVLAAAEYRRLVGQRKSFLEYLRTGESLEGVELVRDSSPVRDVEL